MERVVLAMVSLGFASPSVAHAQEIDQKSAFGNIVRGATVCVGPLGPSDASGVQIAGGLRHPWPDGRCGLRTLAELCASRVKGGCGSPLLR